MGARLLHSGPPSPSACWVTRPTRLFCSYAPLHSCTRPPGHPAFFLFCSVSPAWCLRNGVPWWDGAGNSAVGLRFQDDPTLPWEGRHRVHPAAPPTHTLPTSYLRPRETGREA